MPSATVGTVVSVIRSHNRTGYVFICPTFAHSNVFLSDAQLESTTYFGLQSVLAVSLCAAGRHLLLSPGSHPLNFVPQGSDEARC